MQRFTPNTLINDRFLLKEELSFDSQMGQQTWAVQDSQTSQALIARLHADGRVEWFNDNRPPVVHPPILANKQEEPMPMALSIAPQSPATPVGKRAISFLAIILVVGGLTAGYVYRSSLLGYVQSMRTETTAPADSASQSTTNGATTNTLPGTNDPIAKENTSRQTQPETPETELEVTPVSAPISDRQALRLLTLLKTIPSEKHPAIFSDARRSFAQLRQSTGQQAYVDSLYTLCMGHGAQSFLTHQQNGDTGSRQYAINWYTLAYAIKPTAFLQERLTRLKNGSSKKPVKQARSPKKTDGSLFIADPEVNQ